MTSVFMVPHHGRTKKKGKKKVSHSAAKKRVREMLRSHQESTTILPSVRRCALYRHYDSAGNLLYVGISLSFFRRLMEHRDGSGWFMDIARVDIQWFDSEMEAEEAERVAIMKEAPLHNRQRLAPSGCALDAGRPANPMAPADERLSAWVRKRREDQGLSLEDLAELSGVSSRTIARVESDEARERTSLATFSVLIQALGGRIDVSEENDNYVIACAEKLR